MMLGMAQNGTPPADPLFLTVQQVATQLSLSVWAIYTLLDQGKLEGVYQGRRRYVIPESVDAYVDSLSSTPSAESA
jgi:excisionase family DNA binding protein